MNHIRSLNLHLWPFLPFDVFAGLSSLLENINKIHRHEAMKNRTTHPGLGAQDGQLWPQSRTSGNSNGQPRFPLGGGIRLTSGHSGSPAHFHPFLPSQPLSVSTHRPNPLSSSSTLYLIFSLKWQHYKSHRPFSLRTLPCSDVCVRAHTHTKHFHFPLGMVGVSLCVHKVKGLEFKFNCVSCYVRAYSGPQHERRGPQASEVDCSPWKGAVQDSGPERGLQPACFQGQPGGGMCQQHF